MEERKQFLIEKFRSIIEKNHWHDNEDIYEYEQLSEDEDLLFVYGHNGRFYEFVYKSDDNWCISMYPSDPCNILVWHGLGKGWRKPDESNS